MIISLSHLMYECHPFCLYSFFIYSYSFLCMRCCVKYTMSTLKSYKSLVGYIFLTCPQLQPYSAAPSWHWLGRRAFWRTPEFSWEEFPHLARVILRVPSSRLSYPERSSLISPELSWEEFAYLARVIPEFPRLARVILRGVRSSRQSYPERSSLISPELSQRSSLTSSLHYQIDVSARTC